MGDTKKKNEHLRSGARRILIMFSAVFLIIGAMGIYFLTDPTLSFFDVQEPDSELVDVPKGEDDFDKIENGIHVRTGLVEAEGLMTVVNNCTNCHSAKLVTQNRMNKERWLATIRWMQETQNLWDLGPNEDIIVNYLVTNYPPKKKGRRETLANIEWYELKD
ncbi:monoheme cytochrome C [uncultured Kriegella sp.]|uniref:monoheme cytochrome C n=1 Tax=uncultured Kriegella sp. TaxID=1798910 RepID=UPI0030DA8760|tara:strand:+ start:137211 stop:137696 length:486 start_codon:yes stop_codon:yes gene_type:complete